MNWVERLKQLLCEIYKILGGDCADLEGDAPDWIDTVIAAFDPTNPPTFPGEPERQAFLATLDELEAHLGLPGNSLSATDTGRLLQFIADLRAAV